MIIPYTGATLGPSGDNAEVTQLYVQKLGGCKMVNEGVEFFAKLSDEGIEAGEANWPIDFDPVWLEQCSG